MTIENNLKKPKNGHGQVVADDVSQLPRDQADETGSRTSKHLLLCVNCCKRKNKKLLRSVSKGKRKLFSKKKRRKDKKTVGGKGKKEEGVRGKEYEKGELREKERGKEEVAGRKQERTEAREDEKDVGEMREHLQRQRETGEKEQDKGGVTRVEQKPRKHEAREYEQERGQAREKAQEKKSKLGRKRKHRKQDRVEETEDIFDKGSDTVLEPLAGKSTVDKKRSKQRRKKILEKDDEFVEFQSERDKSERLKRKDREHSPAEDHTIGVEKAHVSYVEEATKKSTTARQLPNFTKDFTTDIEKTCCYLCVQNTLAIQAAMSGKQGVEKAVQVSEEDIDKKMPASEKSKSPAPKVRTVQSSIRVRTRETSTSCPESSAAHKIKKTKSKRKKFKLAKILSKLKRRKKSRRRSVACDTDEIFVKCDNSAKCRWNNECRKGDPT